MRINGQARVSTSPELLAQLTENGKMPKTATVVRLNEVLFHCGKAVNRARLWDESGRIGRDQVPSPGQVFVRLAGMTQEQGAQLDEHYAHAVKHDLY